eukprot:7326270-Pyramimonas_sp.AAC.2
MYFDFLGAVFAARKSPERQRESRSACACVQVFGQSHPGHAHLSEAEHVKAHRTSDEYARLSAARRRITDTSIAAYRFAQEAVLMHFAASHEFLQSVDRQGEATSFLVRLAAAALPCYD